MKMALQNIFLLSNRSALNLKEAIKLLKKPGICLVCDLPVA
jgi:hypothetical protein